MKIGNLAHHCLVAVDDVVVADVVVADVVVVVVVAAAAYVAHNDFAKIGNLMYLLW